MKTIQEIKQLIKELELYPDKITDVLDDIAKNQTEAKTEYLKILDKLTDTSFASDDAERDDMIEKMTKLREYSNELGELYEQVEYGITDVESTTIDEIRYDDDLDVEDKNDDDNVEFDVEYHDDEYGGVE